MKEEIKRPDFPKVEYDHRNCEDAGKYRGVGMAGKVGHHHSNGVDAMPPRPAKSQVKEDYAR